MQQQSSTKLTTIPLSGDTMKVKLINHNEEYAVREIINSFFPKEKLDFLTEELCNDCVISEYSFKDNVHTYKAKAIIDCKTYESELTDSVWNKTQLKRAIANCLKEATGIHLPWGLMTGIRPSKVVREHKLTSGDSAVEYLINEFDTDADKAILAAKVEENESAHIAQKFKNGISLYVGIPFCPTRCLYCSFTSQSVAFTNKLVEPYVEALKKEIRETASLPFVKNKVIETVYFGGGTPTALSAEQIDDILCTLKEYFDLKQIKELTFEAGRPDTITKEKLEVLRIHGISRICINPQTINDKTLEIIGRKHTSAAFLEKFALARELGFNHINCDIIAGLPGEGEKDFEKTLSALETIKPDSVTVHTMSIKHGAFLDREYNMYSLSTAETVNNMLNLASDSMAKMNMLPYYMYRQKNMLGNLENVGYCTNRHECLYNIYIMEEVQSIIALGAGGSTKVVNDDSIERVFNVKEVSEYIKRIDEMIERKRSFWEQYE